MTANTTSSSSSPPEYECPYCELPKAQKPELDANTRHCKKCHHDKSLFDMVVGSNTECKLCHSIMESKRQKNRKNLGTERYNSLERGTKAVLVTPSNGDNDEDNEDTSGSDSVSRRNTMKNRVKELEKENNELFYDVEKLQENIVSMEERIEKLEKIIKKMSLAFKP